MSWMGKWSGGTSGRWYGWLLEAVGRRIDLLRAKFVIQKPDEIFVRKTQDERTR
jgi:hypothetical protein